MAASRSGYSLDGDARKLDMDFRCLFDLRSGRPFSSCERVTGISVDNAVLCD